MADGYLEWRPEFETGVQRIDAQHRELFTRTRELLAAIAAGRRDAVGPALQYLRRYVAEHFAVEQALMVASGYPHADAHATDHARFAADLLALEEKRATEPTSLWLASTVGVRLATWLRDHVLGADRELGRYLRASEQEGEG